MLRMLIVLVMILSVIPANAYPAASGKSVRLAGSSQLGFFGKSSVTNSTTATPTITAQESGFVAGVTDLSPSEAGLHNLEFEIMNLLNAERTKAGASALTLNPELSKIAFRKTQDMVKNQYFEHELQPYETSFEMLSTVGINYQSAGENLAFGYTKPSAVMQVWMNSADHRYNILQPDFNQFGISVMQNSRGVYYWTVVFVKTY